MRRPSLRRPGLAVAVPLCLSAVVLVAAVAFGALTGERSSDGAP